MLAHQRNYSIAKLASYELLDYPKALFHAGGFYRKSNKSELMNEIEKRSDCVQPLPLFPPSPNTRVHLFDGMVLVHVLQVSKFKTFYEFGQAFFRYISSFLAKPSVSRVDVIFDRYDDLGIKELESMLRSEDSEVGEIVIDNPHTRIPKDIKKLLTNPGNKLKLVKFLCQNSFKFVKLHDNQQLILSGGFENMSKCYKIQGNSMFDVIELQGNHLEADTRIFSHAFFDLKPNTELVIHSVDTDVFVLAIYFWSKFKSMGCPGLWFQVHNQKPRTLACHAAAEFLTEEVCEILPGLHAFTGCDSVSKIGTKKKGLDLMAHVQFRNSLAPLGNGSLLNVEEFKAIENLYLRILDKNETDVDVCRANIFSNSCGVGLNLTKVPCTSDALHLHSLRASLQTYIWKSAINANYLPMNFTSFGYTIKDDSLLPIPMSKDAFPNDLVKACNCKKNCSTRLCNCRKHNEKCVKICGCDFAECKNSSN
ncbi:hypothetical protein QAD02_021956 [Eretmocerus hayati]|uniref:Uncharacterized protein n=1 Tax=Eretmocerus hayati TaxID=131215 RepID=A0ACC2PRZ1_9HYME|nr:hypothetical protein QAD02_021956 [Eretmocerus hayati]